MGIGCETGAWDDMFVGGPCKLPAVEVNRGAHMHQSGAHFV